MYSSLGIILTDQLLSDVPPTSHILNPVSLLDDNSENLDTDASCLQVSARRELISWIERLTPEEAKNLFKRYVPLTCPLYNEPHSHGQLRYQVPQ